MQLADLLSSTLLIIWAWTTSQIIVSYNLIRKHSKRITEQIYTYLNSLLGAIGQSLLLGYYTLKTS